MTPASLSDRPGLDAPLQDFCLLELFPHNNLINATKHAWQVQAGGTWTTTVAGDPLGAIQAGEILVPLRLGLSERPTALVLHPLQEQLFVDLDLGLVVLSVPGSLQDLVVLAPINLASLSALAFLALWVICWHSRPRP